MSDRRKTARVGLNRMGVVHADGRTIPCKLIDLSEGGVAVSPMTRERLRLRGPVVVEFRLGGANTRRVRIEAELTGDQGDEARTIWHLRAVALAAELRSLLQDFVANHRTSPRLSQHRLRLELRARFEARRARAVAAALG